MRVRPGTATPPPPPDVPELVDTEKDTRVRRVLDMLACGTPEATIFRAITREFAVPLEVARADYADVRDAMREHLDSESSIDGQILGAMARLQSLVQRYYTLAMTPTPDRILDTPGPDPDHPERNAIYRTLTPAEKAAETSARVAAAGVTLKANEALVRLVGRRSQRWSEKPSAVLVMAPSAGLSEEDRNLLVSLGMVSK